jgi:hypothetical protein
MYLILIPFYESQNKSFENRRLTTLNPETMRKMKLPLIISSILIVGIISCVKSDDYSYMDLQSTTQTWTDNFELSSAIDSNWKLYGNPKPVIIEMVNGQHGIFDNNGSSPTRNYAVCKTLIKKGISFTVESEVMIKILNQEGSSICPGIAVSRNGKPVLIDNENPTSFSMQLVYVGTNANWLEENLQGHTWFMMEYLSQEEEIYSSGYIPADLNLDKWHTLKIVLPTTRIPVFYCDNALVWAPDKKMIPMITDQNIILGFTSAGDPETSAGKAYHNLIKFTYVLP